ncbi:uncharacterized protein LOC110402522 [Numida meleagris]|uniref:uncharacterized protein LOC110402522 n=1 Tax=Numida meleagris TaxID=8996 RepID=UPI000B3D89D7|nr:uncharacterized protein LOC110402522 [Numida meleagris]
MPRTPGRSAAPPVRASGQRAPARSPKLLRASSHAVPDTQRGPAPQYNRAHPNPAHPAPPPTGPASTPRRGRGTPSSAGPEGCRGAARSLTSGVGRGKWRGGCQRAPREGSPRPWRRGEARRGEARRGEAKSRTARPAPAGAAPPWPARCRGVAAPPPRAHGRSRPTAGPLRRRRALPAPRRGETARPLEPGTGGSLTPPSRPAAVEASMISALQCPTAAKLGVCMGVPRNE